MKQLKLSLAFALVVLGCAAASQAETITFTCQPDGDWSNQNCWDLGRRPASGDDVFIPQFRTCNMDISAEVNSITLGTVQAQGGALNVEPGITLTIKADSTMYGPITLQGSGSTLRISPPGNTTLTMGGCCGGWIQGENANAVVTVDQGDTFRTGGDGITIYGQMQITGQGTFVNGYRVVPAGGTIELRTAGGLDDTTAASWELSQDAGRLLFAADLPSGISLDGTFQILIDLGEIQVAEALTTSGRLRMWNGLLDVNENLTMGDSIRETYMEMTGGKIVVAPGKKFEHK